MAVNSKIEDFDYLIQSLKIYQSSIEESCQVLTEAVRLYDEGINDRTSKICRKKITKMCERINPHIIERIDCLLKYLISQREQLAEMNKLIKMDDDDRYSCIHGESRPKSFRDRRNEFVSVFKTDPVYASPVSSNFDSEDESIGQRVKDITKEYD